MINRRQTLKLSGSFIGASIIGVGGSKKVLANPEDRNLADASRWVYSPSEQYDRADSMFALPYTDDDTVYVGTEGGTMYAIDTESGDEKWSFESGLPIWSSPTVSNNAVFFGLNPDSDGTSGPLYAVNSQDGSLRWEFSDYSGSVGSGSLVSNENSVYFVDPNEDTLHAVDTSSGDQQWQYTSEPSFSQSINGSPSLDNGTIFVGGGDGLLAIDSETGEQIWTSDGGRASSQFASPSIRENTVFFLGDDALYATNKNTGETLWSFEGESGQFSGTLTIADDQVIITDGSIGDDNSTIVSLDSATGEREWSIEISADIITTSVISDTIYAGTSSDDYGGDFYAIDTQTGDELWSASIKNGELRLSRTSTDDTVFVASTTGNLYAVERGNNPYINNSSTTIFEQFTQTDSSKFLLALAGMGTAGGAYVGFKRYFDQDSKKDTRPNEVEEEFDNTPHTTEITIPEYDEIQFQGTIRESPKYQLQQAQTNDEQFCVLTPNLQEAETMSTAVIEKFNDRFNSWSGMDTHPNLLAVYHTESKPIPWAAVEQIDGVTLVDQVTDLSIGETLDCLEQICEAVHHVNRYGTLYENLITESVLYTDDDQVKLRGLLDQFVDPDPWYNAPEEFDDESSEQSAVYRIGLIGYELLTGTLPYEEYPTGDPGTATRRSKPIPPSEQVNEIGESVDQVLLKALSNEPGDRHETVLHLRDELQKLID